MRFLGFFFLFPLIMLLASLHTQMLHTRKGGKGPTFTAHPPWFCARSPAAPWLRHSALQQLAHPRRAAAGTPALPEDLIRSPEKSTQRSPLSSLGFKSGFSTIPFQKGGTGTNFPCQLVWELMWGGDQTFTLSISVYVFWQPTRKKKTYIILAPVNDF